MTESNHIEIGASLYASSPQELRERVAYFEARLVKAGQERRELQEERDRFQRMFARATEALGAIHKALSEGSETTVVGMEVEQVRQIKSERDALAAHVERLHNALEPKILDWIDCGMAANGRHRDAWAVELRSNLHQALADKSGVSASRLKPQWQAEGIESLVPRVAGEVGRTLGLSEDEIIEVEGWLGGHGELRRQAETAAVLDRMGSAADELVREIEGSRGEGRTS